ncbi:uncharacterized protein AKAW2_40980S [Aspergillus luchuensis]|uniref:Uncharacterized protein n=1 Tax=Aspergillus kawachii TaxID=1069201 RepID=A0A7R7WAB0_ASPKA|nr:uncharacterized protein AKAW2_40980S [Aspergillus luchuensis]BCR99297.1 hypothetical protein AKAW2_40980S [Aspergillus luchuensis]
MFIMGSVVESGTCKGLEPSVAELRSYEQSKDSRGPREIVVLVCRDELEDAFGSSSST